MIEEKLLTNLGKIQHFAHLNVTYNTQAYLWELLQEASKEEFLECPVI
jgi:hypothetical protein